MSYNDIVKIIPNEVRHALFYFDTIIGSNYYSGNNILKFSSIKNDDRELCCLYTSLKYDDYREFKIPVEYDCLFYSQLLISLLDNNLNSYNVDFTSIHKVGDYNSYVFYLFRGKNYITVTLESTSDLDKLIKYCNERILAKHEFNILNQRGVRI